ncbi:MAG: ABC transporter permease [Thermoplasmatota archaeon]
MNVWVVAKKTLLELRRNRRALRFMVGLPVVILLLMGFAFHSAGQTTYKVGIQNDDTGPAGAAFLTRLQSLTTSDGQALIVLTNETSSANASSDLRAGQIDLYVHLPANFSTNLGHPNTPLPIETTSNPSSQTSLAASQIVDQFATSFADASSGRAPSVADSRSTITAASLTAFDFIAPGLFIYGIIAIAPQIATSLAREQEQGTLTRIRMSPMRTWEFLSGVAIAFGTVAIGSLLLMLYAANLVGFHNQGSLADILAVIALTLVSILGVGLMIASFVSTQQEVSSVAVLITLPLSFLSGVFFPMPPVLPLAFGGKSWTVYNLLPTTNGVDALRQVATFGSGLGDVVLSLIVLGILSILYFGVGIVLYHRKRLAAS